MLRCTRPSLSQRDQSPSLPLPPQRPPSSPEGKTHGSNHPILWATTQGVRYIRYLGFWDPSGPGPIPNMNYIGFNIDNKNGPGPKWARGPSGPRAQMGQGPSGPRAQVGPGPNEPRAQVGPGPKRARAQVGPGHKWAQGQSGPGAQEGPGPKWAQGPSGPGPSGPTLSVKITEYD